MINCESFTHASHPHHTARSLLRQLKGSDHDLTLQETRQHLARGIHLPAHHRFRARVRDGPDLIGTYFLVRVRAFPECVSP